MGRFGRKGRKSSTGSSRGESEDESNIGSVKTPVAGVNEFPAFKPANTSTSGMEDIPVEHYSQGGGGIGGDGRTSTATSSVNTEKTKEIQGKIDDVTKVMEENIKNAMERGEEFKSLEAKTKEVESGAQKFSKNASVVKRNLWWKNMKMAICIGVIILALIGAGIAIWYLTSSGGKK